MLHDLYINLVERFLVAAGKILIFSAGLLNYSMCWKLSRILGWISYILNKSWRITARKNLSIIRPDIKDEKSIKSIIIDNFSHMFKNFFELLKYQELSREQLIDHRMKFAGDQFVDRALLQKKGVILLAAHFGNWELQGAAWSIMGYDIHAFYLDMRFRKLSRLLNLQRSVSGIKLIGREALKESVRSLKNNGLLGIIADQDGGETGIPVSFFNETVYFPNGAARLQRMTQAAVLPNLMIRNSDNTYTSVVFPPLEMVKTKNKEEDFRQNSQKMVSFFEDIIRKYPEQWLLVYDRFKIRRKELTKK